MPNFPIKKEGDSLGASHINQLSAAAAKAEAYQRNLLILDPPLGLQTFDVVQDNCDGDPDLYRIVPRYWDNRLRQWKSGDASNNRGFRLDSTDTGQVFAVGDKIQAYYDNQRGSYIPLGPRNRQVIMKDDLAAAVSTKTDRSTAYAYLMQKNSSGDLVRTSKTILVTNPFKNISIAAGIYAKIEYIDGEWQPYAADCPSPESSESV